MTSEIIDEKHHSRYLLATKRCTPESCDIKFPNLRLYKKTDGTHALVYCSSSPTRFGLLKKQIAEKLPSYNFEITPIQLRGGYTDMELVKDLSPASRSKVHTRKRNGSNSRSRSRSKSGTRQSQQKTVTREEFFKHKEASDRSILDLQSENKRLKEDLKKNSLRLENHEDTVDKRFVVANERIDLFKSSNDILTNKHNALDVRVKKVEKTTSNFAKEVANLAEEKREHQKRLEEYNQQQRQTATDVTWIKKELKGQHSVPRQSQSGSTGLSSTPSLQTSNNRSGNSNVKLVLEKGNESQLRSTHPKFAVYANQKK